MKMIPTSRLWFVVTSLLCLWLKSAGAECPTALLPSEVLSTVSYNYTAGSFAKKIANLQAETAAMFQTNSVDAYGVAVIHRNTTLFTAGNVATPFRVGSVTKVFTAMAALLLRHQGRLRLDDPVTKFLPTFSVLKSDGAAITLRELMAHVSGLPRELCAKVYDCGDLVAEKDILESIAQMELVRPPWNFLPVYSNLGISVLGHAWEKATSPRQSWSEYIKDQIFTPLKMNDTGVDFAHVQLAPGNVYEYPSNHSIGWSGPAGDMYSTALDLAKFLKFLMNPQPELLSASVIREWTRAATVFPDSARVGFALPWEVLTVTTSRNVSVPIVTKSGGLGSYAALVAFDAATELGVAVVVSAPDGSVTNDLVNKILGDLIPEVSSMNTEILASLYSGVYVCNRSAPVLSRYRHVGFPIDVGDNNVNKTLQVVDGSVEVDRGLNAAVKISLLVDGVAKPQMFTASLILKNGHENTFWAYPGDCLTIGFTLSFATDALRPNYAGSFDLLEFEFDPAAGLLRWPAFGAICHKSN